MKMTETLQDDVLVLKLEGELMGGDEAKPFQDRLYEAIRDGITHVVVEMSGVKWMNSSGLGILMAGLTTLRSSDGDLKLACLSERVKRPIEITKLNQVLQICDSVDQAIQSFEEEG
ncbi:STAS domain-containing protein [bacterium]|nr:STAS domain-containing protein [bacterium]